MHQINLAKGGDPIVIFHSGDENIQVVGNVNTPDMVDFFATIFRCSPGLKAQVEAALERSECLDS